MDLCFDFAFGFGVKTLVSSCRNRPGTPPNHQSKLPTRTKPKNGIGGGGLTPAIPCGTHVSFVREAIRLNWGSLLGGEDNFEKPLMVGCSNVLLQRLLLQRGWMCLCFSRQYDWKWTLVPYSSRRGKIRYTKKQ